MPGDYIERLKQIPLIDILHDIYGIDARRNGERYYCKIRAERTSSCCIYPDNSWYDFGGSVGGDTISLVQFMEQCDNKTAMKKLSDYYGIEREHQPRNFKMLWDYEWKKLGIQPDMVSKNLSIHTIFADEPPNGFYDVNLNIDDPSAVEAFQAKYYVPISTFREKNPAEYHSFLRRHVWEPMLYDREDYYSSLLCDFRLSNEISGEDFARRFVGSKDRHMAEAQRINEQCKLLRRAVDDISLLKVPLFGLEPQKDLDGILNGQIRFEPSKVKYLELCRWAKSVHEKVNCVIVPYDDYLALHLPHDSPLRGIPHSAFYQNGICNLCVIASKTEQIKTIFGEKVIKTEPRFDGFSCQSKQKSTQNCRKNALSFPEV